jgi:HNH endonuclease
MAHKPGSFSKNFGWETEERSLRRLHSAVRSGFSGALQSVERSAWRERSQLPDHDRELIALNFFLHNLIVGGQNMVSVDELVLQAVNFEHSPAFDHLALFALNLSEAGERTGHNNGEAQPILWANEFVREDLWEDGAWEATNLNQPGVKDALTPRIDAVEETIAKCVANYRRIFTLCGHDVDGSGPMNGTAHLIGPTAYFLAWDRLILDGVLAQQPGIEVLKRVIEEKEVHKLLGTSLEFVRDTSGTAASDYLALGGRGRLNATALAAPPPASRLRSVDLQSLAEQLKTDATVERRPREISQQVRDRKLASELKAAYENRCMFCGELLAVSASPEQHYSEAAHIKPLGAPHNGPDTLPNLLVLCPNHHLQFDYGILRLQLRDGEYVIMSKQPEDPLHSRTVEFVEHHELDYDFVRYHFDWHHDN